MKKKFILPPIVALLVVAAGFFWYFRLHAPPAGDHIAVSGNIEAVTVQLGFRIPGLVEARPVFEGQQVRRGDPVARLETSELRQEEALRRAELTAAQASLAEMRAGFRVEETEQARAALQRARAELAKARSDFERQSNLFQANVISRREMEETEAAFEVARARAAEASQRLDLHRRGNRPEQIAQAEAKADQAEAALAQAQTRLGFADLAAPIDAFILSENVEPGEHVAAGTPVVTLADLDHVWLRAYVEGADLGRVQLGQTAWVTSDSYPGRRYRGRVSFIASEAEFTPKQVQTREQRTRLVYRIKIDVENPGRELKPGMLADARIVLEGGDAGH